MSSEPVTETEAHPAAWRVEAFFAGEPDAEVEAHVEGCEACARYLGVLAAERDTMLAAESTADFLRRPALAAALQTPLRPSAPARRRGMLLGLAIAAALVAAGVLLPGVWNPPDRGPTADTIRLKGAPQAAFVVLRGTRQERMAGQAALQPGDRFRVELTMPAAGVWTVGILEGDGSWTPLLDRAEVPVGVRYLPEEGLTVDDTPTTGRILAGPPESIAKAVATRAPAEIERWVVGRFTAE